MKGLFLDASGGLDAVYHAVRRPGDPPIDVTTHSEVAPSALPGLLDGYDTVIIDHTTLPTDIMAQCPGIRDVIFLGTGAASYMDPAGLAARGITVHTIKGYGDTAVAEHAITLMFAAARGLARMDRGMRAGQWLVTEGMQLRGKTLGLIGYGGVAAEAGRIALGIGMEVTAWNYEPRSAPGIRFASLEGVLGESHVVSVHLLLNEETRGFMNAERLARMRPGAILINTARGAIVDDTALIAALRAGHLAHAALDVFDPEPLPPGHPYLAMDNVTLSAHSAFATPEATQTLVRRALDIAAELAKQTPP